MNNMPTPSGPGTGVPHQAAFDNYGETLSKQQLKEEILRRIIYAGTGAMSVGQRLVGVQEIPDIKMRFAYPGEMTADYPVDITGARPTQRIEWEEFDTRLHMGQVEYAISDEAKLTPGMTDLQAERTRQAATDAMARRVDENILSTLRDGAHSDNVDAETGGDEWNASGVDITDKVWSMWKDILVNAPLSNLNQQFDLVLPVEIWAETNRLELINNIQQRAREYVEGTFNLNLHPNRVGFKPDDEIDLQDTAIMLIRGPDTALHGVLSPQTAAARGVPLVEQERDFNHGEKYLIKRWFNTGVMEHESDEAGKSPRIAVRTNVNANA